MIGNSFTDDATEYLNWIVKNSGIDENTCCVYRVTQGGSSLQTWRDKYKNNAIVSLERKAGLLAMGLTEGTLQELLHQNWDVVSLQQLSNYSNDITTYSPYLTELLSYIKSDCLNKNIAICWHLTWSYCSKHTSEGPKGYVGWSSIVSTVEQMIRKYGVDIVIPSGTAIQNARATTITTEKSLTRDGLHLDSIGKYIAGCTVFESLFEPVYGISLLNISWHPQNITDSVAAIARTSAIKAVDNWHEAPFIISSELKDEFLIFPNPTTDYVMIYTDSISNPIVCAIYDSLGKRIYKEKILINGIFRIDFSQFKRGTYTIQLKCGKIEKTQRIEKL